MTNLATRSDRAIDAGLRFDFDRVPDPQFLWTTSGPMVSSTMVGDRFFAVQENLLIEIELATGAIREHGLNGPDGKISITEILANFPDGLILNTSSEAANNTLICYSITENAVRWSRMMESKQCLTLATGAEQVFVLDANNQIHARSLKTGAGLWTQQLPKASGWYGLSMLVDRDLLLIASGGKLGFETKGYLLALDIHRGGIQWMYATKGEAKNPPVLLGDRVLVGHQESGCREVSCLELFPETALGTCVWTQTLDRLPSFGTANANLNCWGSFQGGVHGLDSRSGEELWYFHRESSTGYQTAPRIMGYWVFVECDDGYLYGLDAANGSLRWKHRPFGASTDGGLGLDSCSEFLLAINEQAGVECFKIETDPHPKEFADVQ